MDQATASNQAFGGGPNPVDRSGICLLSLDGGGVRGLSTLHILKGIMTRLNRARQKENLPAVKPCEVFDLIGGTSTGGIIAIMIGRLEMDIDECISAYAKLMKTVFQKRLHRIPSSFSGQIQSQFDSTTLRDAIDEVIKGKGFSPADLFNDGQPHGCRVFVCATAKELRGITRIRSYDLPEKANISATISEAALATSAATSFFNPVTIGARHFVDGALGANNPVEEVEGEASDIWCPETGKLQPLVKCFISLGTGHPGRKAVEDHVFRFVSKTLIDIATETEDTEKKFIGRWREHFDQKRYFRLNVEQGLQDVGLEEYKEQGRIEQATADYLDHQDRVFRVRDCVENLKEKQKGSEAGFVKKYNDAYRRNQAATAVVLVPYLKNACFVGRTAILEELKQQPLYSDSQTRVSLFGLGGIGKTQIALEYTYWLRTTHPDVSIFWVHASNAERFRQSFTSIAHECHIPGHDDPKADMLSLVQKWLERKDRGWWVMVLDNADDAQLFFPSPSEPEQANGISREEHLEQYIPGCAHGSILVTTRNKQAGLKLAKRPPIEIDTMNDSESEQLLRANLRGQGAASSELLALSSRLEHLPLALVQAAAFIEANTITVSEYLRLLDKSDQNLVNLLSEEFETVGRDSTPRAVAETWILSFNQIQQQNAFAGELLSLMSFFDRQAIPAELLAYYGEQQGQDKRGEIQFQKALGVLKAFSFVSEAKDLSLGVHRLVQLVLRKWLAREKRIKHFAGQALLAVSHAYPFGFYENWAICSKYLPHVYAVLDFEGTGSKDEKTARASMLHNAAGLFLYHGQWKDAEKLLVVAVDLRRDVLGLESSGTLSSMNNLASTYRNQDRWEEAEKLFMQVAEMCKTRFGAGHPLTLASIGNLAATYRSQGRWEEAEKLEVQTTESFKKLGADHPATLTSMANLASTYRDQGRWEEAEKLEVQVVETRKTKFGPDHPDTVKSMNNLALTYRDQGRWEEAEKLLMQVTDTNKMKLRDDHPLTLAGMANLALTFWNQGRWVEAEKLNRQVMKICKAKLGTDHSNTLTIMANLASMYTNRGRWEEAEKLQVQVMETRETKFGPDHPDTLNSMNNLAFTWKDMGRHGDALRLIRTCSTLQQRVLGPEHARTVSTLQALVEWEKESERLAQENDVD